MARAASLEKHWTQRRYLRHAVDAKVRMHVFAGDDCTMLVHGHCRELGRGGMGVMLSTQLRPGESVWMELSLCVSGYATVCYNNGFYHGFEFTLLRHNDRARLDRLCDSYGEEPVHADSFACGNR